MANGLQRLAFGAPSSGDPGRVCFADEIAIDFPSVRAAVTRMRDGFLGSGSSTPPLQTQITLSLRDALQGCDVVVSLPIPRTCVACGGRGEVWDDACGACCGLGDALDHRDVRVAVPAGVRDGTRVRLSVRADRARVTYVDVQISVS